MNRNECVRARESGSREAVTKEQISEIAAPTQEGDQRLIDLLTQAFGIRHPAVDDLAALILRANANRRDVTRYRWLREQHWNESDMAVVCDPKKSVKLGYDCPSGERLDEAIDTAMKRSGEQKA